MDKIIAFLVAHGVSQEIASKVTAIEGHVAGILKMLVLDGQAAVEKFINDEYAKVVAALQA